MGMQLFLESCIPSRGPTKSNYSPLLISSSSSTPLHPANVTKASVYAAQRLASLAAPRQSSSVWSAPATLVRKTFMESDHLVLGRPRGRSPWALHGLLWQSSVCLVFMQLCQPTSMLWRTGGWSDGLCCPSPSSSRLNLLMPSAS